MKLMRHQTREALKAAYDVLTAIDTGDDVCCSFCFVLRPKTGHLADCLLAVSLDKVKAALGKEE
jgi:hypothetical protein